MTAPDHTSESDLRRCSKCDIPKPNSEYYPRKDSKDGLRLDCKDCVRSRAIIYYLEHSETAKRRVSEYTSTHFEEVQVRQLRYRKEHKADHAEYAKAYRSNNKAKIVAQKARWYAKNRESVRIRTAQQHRLKPYIARAANRRRKDRVKQLPNNFLSADWKHCLDYWRGQCAYCGNPPSLFDRDLVLHMDHYIPINYTEHCPGTIPTNIVPACQSCNYSKKTNDAHEWLVMKFGKRKGRLIEQHIQEYFDSLKEMEN